MTCQFSAGIPIRMTLHLIYAFTSGTPCGVATNQCSDRCVEVNGTETCLCFSGRMLQNDGSTCVGKYLALYMYLHLKYLSSCT